MSGQDWNKSWMVGILAILLVCTNSGSSAGNANAAKKPLVCSTAPEQAEAVKFADSIAGIVDSSLAAGSLLFKDAAKRDQYTNVHGAVISALKNGWGAPGVCDAIANPIADPLKQIPFAGIFISGGVKVAVKKACEDRKKQLGC